MQNSILKADERIDDLQRNGYKIIQNPSKFCFGMDAVLLSAFACEGMSLRAKGKPKVTEVLEKPEKQTRILDMGTGTGVIPTLMAGRLDGASFIGLEIQEDMAEMAARSVTLNHLENRLKIVHGDIKEASKIFSGASFDVITVNPPYMNENHGLKNPTDAKAIARHEVLCTLDDILEQASKCLVPGGKLFMVHRPHRLAEIFEKMRVNKLEPKRIRMVHPHIGDEAKMVLIEAARSGGSWLKVENPLVIYDEEGKYTKEIYEIYEG